MWLTYKQVLRFIFPPSPDEALLEATPVAHFTELHVRVRHGVITLLPYYDPAVRAAIHVAKFHHHHTARKALGAALATYTEHHPCDLIIPVPLSNKRYRERGYNQVTEIIKAAKVHVPNLTYNEGCLVRTKHTKPQTELDRTNRLTNVSSAFSVRPRATPANIRDLNVVLLDDVVTTGSTMRAARAELMKLRPKSVTCVAIAG